MKGQREGLHEDQNHPVSCKTTTATQKTHQLYMLTHKDTLNAPKCGFIAQNVSQTANSGENVKTCACNLVINPPASCKTTTSTQKFLNSKLDINKRL